MCINSAILFIQEIRMKLQQLIERENRIPNPLVHGNIDYDVLDEFDEIENDYHEAFHHGRKDTVDLSVQERVRMSREHMQSALTKTMDLPISQLIPIEPDYDKVHVDSIRNKNNPPCSVYKHRGKFYINDGNHRVLADHANGKDTTKADVIDTADIQAATDRMWADKV